VRYDVDKVLISTGHVDWMLSDKCYRCWQVIGIFK
jgi:hypothetical protein